MQAYQLKETIDESGHLIITEPIALSLVKWKSLSYNPLTAPDGLMQALGL